jgi:hypothetical protein
VLRLARIGSVTAAVALTGGCGGSGQSASRAAHEKPLVVDSAPVRRLPAVARSLGPPDPHDFDLALLVPRRARVRQVWYLRGRHAGRQVLVEWIQSARASIYTGDLPPHVRWGLTLWTQRPRRAYDYQAPWQGVAIPLVRYPPGSPALYVRFADVTGDGDPDVLVEQDPGTNHGCGPHEVVATLAHRQVFRVFRAWLCETTLRGEHGLLALDLPYYVGHDSVCCWSKVERRRLRWNGRRYVVASDRIVPVRR